MKTALTGFAWPLFKLLSSVLILAVLYIQNGQLDDAKRERDDFKTELATQREAARLAGEKLAARDALDTQHTKELNRVQTENRALQLDVADSRRRLRIQAICPAVPSATGTAGLADGGSAELAADARSDYFTLRDQLALSRQQILGLHDYIRRIVLTAPATATPLKSMEAMQ
ncbi:endopeptidase [Pseudomonas cichorii]|nr:endopeptidase [Pseudomonas cichorii]